MPSPAEPPQDCSLCPRLLAYRLASPCPDWHNAPVPSFGPDKARLLIVGLAPGLKGANRTGRPFTGDAAGDVLFPALAKFGFAHGRYQAHAQDKLELLDTIISNAIRCVPPQNKPASTEISNCLPFLAARIKACTRLQAILALGVIAHKSVLRALGRKAGELPFIHGQQYRLNTTQTPITLFDSYHCSRYNINTRRLTLPMFDAVLQHIRSFLDQQTA